MKGFIVLVLASNDRVLMNYNTPKSIDDNQGHLPGHGEGGGLKTSVERGPSTQRRDTDTYTDTFQWCIKIMLEKMPLLLPVSHL
jgi:hypothetical protein